MYWQISRPSSIRGRKIRIDGSICLQWNCLFATGLISERLYTHLQGDTKTSSAGEHAAAAVSCEVAAAAAVTSEDVSAATNEDAAAAVRRKDAAAAAAVTGENVSAATGGDAAAALLLLLLLLRIWLKDVAATGEVAADVTTRRASMHDDCSPLTGQSQYVLCIDTYSTY